MNYKKIAIFTLFMVLFLFPNQSKAFLKKEKPAVNYQQATSGYPEKYNAKFLKTIKVEYKSVTKDEVVCVALDMMKGTIADFSRSAILGYNLSESPVKIEFKDLASINKDYQNFDALGWKKGKKLYIYINPRHADAPPSAIAALISHEALHQDEYNSLAEETYAWTMEAAVWYEMTKLYPDSAQELHPLITRENTLKQLFEKGNFSDRYIKKTVLSNQGYRNLPQTSPGFEKL